MKRTALFAFLFALSSGVWAASPWAGVWVMRDTTSKFRVTMTVEEAGPLWKITYKIPVPDGKGSAATSIMSVEVALDGKDAPVLMDGKPSGQTMDIRKIDDRHTHTVVKFQGKQSGISKSELSLDGKLITTDNDFGAQGPHGAAGKYIQYWDRQ